MYSIVCAILFIVGLMRNESTLLVASGLFAIANGCEFIANAIRALKREIVNK